MIKNDKEVLKESYTSPEKALKIIDHLILI